MADVFISYAREDRDTARKLAGALETRGWSVWWDRMILAGQTYDEVIERELDSAKVVVVLWSKDSVGSEWVKNEAAAAAERGVFIPVQIETVKLPLEFRRRQTVDLSDWDGDSSHSGLQPLYNGISAVITGVAPVQQMQKDIDGFWKRRRKPILISAVVVVVIAVVAVAIMNQNNSRPRVVKPDNHRILESGIVSPNNSNPPSTGKTDTNESRTRPPSRNDRNKLVRELTQAQRVALNRIQEGNLGEAFKLITQNERNINSALESFPNDVDLLVLLGYELKNKYMSSNGIQSGETRKKYLLDAYRLFKQAIQIDSRNASAYNGAGNIMYFLGRYDDAIRQYDKALNLDSNYSAARHDRQLAIQARDR